VRLNAVAMHSVNVITTKLCRRVYDGINIKNLVFYSFKSIEKC
jgi:hypothetical protein